MQFYFDSEIARQYSVEEAIFVHSVQYWCWKNECNGKNCVDGKYWTYNTTEALTKLFPFWSVGQINRIIEKCKKNGLILVRTRNKKSLDKTRNFAITEIVKSIYRNRQIHFTESEKPFDENEKCYKEQLGTQVGTQVKADEPLSCLPTAVKNVALDFAGNDAELLQALDGFCTMRKSIRKPIATVRQMTLILNKLQDEQHQPLPRRTMIAMLNESEANSWTSIYPPKAEAPAAAVAATILDRGADEWQ